MDFTSLPTPARLAVSSLTVLGELRFEYSRACFFCAAFWASVVAATFQSSGSG